MLSKEGGIRVLAVLIMMGMLMVPEFAMADRDRGHDRGRYHKQYQHHRHHDYVYHPVVSRGFSFSYSNGSVDVSYRTPRSSYVVVRPRTVIVREPAVLVSPQTVFIPAPKYVSPEDLITINVPNCHGGYNAIQMTRTGIGFVGPQGEFYHTFPTVQQLSVLYGK